MKKTLLLLLSTLVIHHYFSQSHNCDGIRYKNIVFANVDSSMGVQYGNNNTIGGSNQNLLMDIYSPQGDTVSKRPLIVLAHGGSFVSGNRSELAELCRYFASQGYVAATISYRLIDIIPLDSNIFIDGVIKAVSDMKASIRYFYENAASSNTYKIDTNHIFVGGVSAGALTAIHSAYLDSTDNIATPYLNAINTNGGFDGNSSTNLQYGSTVKGVLNYSGAIGNTSWVNINESPIYSAHDDNDGVVPCQFGQAPGGSPIYVYVKGSCLIDSYATAIGLKSELYLVTGSTGHVSFFGNPAQTDTVLQQSSDFLFEIICSTASIEQNISNEFQIFPNPSNGFIKLKTNSSNHFKLIVKDMQGRSLKNLNHIKSDQEIDIKDLKKGFYLISIVDKHSIISTTRIYKE